MISVYLSALICWHFTVSRFRNPLINVYIMILIVCIKKSWYPWHHFSALFQNPSCFFLSGDAVPTSLPCILFAAALKNCWHPTPWCLTCVWMLKLYLLLSPHAENSEHLTRKEEEYQAVLSFLLVILSHYAWNVNQFNLIS